MMQDKEASCGSAAGSLLPRTTAFLNGILRMSGASSASFRPTIRLLTTIC